MTGDTPAMQRARVVRMLKHRTGRIVNAELERQQLIEAAADLGMGVRAIARAAGLSHPAVIERLRRRRG